MTATVVFDLAVAILLGIVYSAILYMAKSSRIKVSFSAIDVSRLQNKTGASNIPESAGVAYITGSLFFGAVDEFNRRMLIILCVTISICSDSSYLSTRSLCINPSYCPTFSLLKTSLSKMGVIIVVMRC